MFMQARDKMEEEFSKPVESIMRCEDFKSNFARRLSNRYSSKTLISPSRPDTALKLRPPANVNEIVCDAAPERIEPSPQLSKNTNMEQSGEAVKPPDKPTKKDTDITRTVLNMEVETLRWQLAQIEANRQMHIALLKQIVSFLNRVKDHIEHQSNGSLRKQNVPSRLLPRSFNTADLPRSRSVVHVNRNLEYALPTPKKFSTRKISKSITSVNGFKDCNDVWIHSKVSPTTENENSQKISEEMSRLITLANTVLSTKIPDLSCNDKNVFTNTEDINNIEVTINTEQNADFPLNHTEDISTLFKSNENNISTTGTENDLLIQMKGENYDNFVEHNFTDMKFTLRDIKETNGLKEESDFPGTALKGCVGSKNDFNSTFVEDESGFSSMSSFQEIGIPIISIIPPSPCKEIGFMEEIADKFEDEEKWKTDNMELEKQTVKVFWV